MAEVEEVEIDRGKVRLRKLHYHGNLTEDFMALPAGQPFGESAKGWPYRILSLSYEPGPDRTVVTLEPYPVDAYAHWLERELAKMLERRAAR